MNIFIYYLISTCKVLTFKLCKFFLPDIWLLYTFCNSLLNFLLSIKVRIFLLNELLELLKRTFKHSGHHNCSLVLYFSGVDLFFKLKSHTFKLITGSTQLLKIFKFVWLHKLIFNNATLINGFCPFFSITSNLNTFPFKPLDIDVVIAKYNII